MLYCYHGTNKENAEKILIEGFNPESWFAYHLENAIKFGGKYVFMVEFDETKFCNTDTDIDEWQFWIQNRIKADKIHRLRIYDVEEILLSPADPASEVRTRRMVSSTLPESTN